MDFEPSARSREYVARVTAFVRAHVEPIEPAYWREVEATCRPHDLSTWRHPAALHALREKARAEGLWNLFLPDPAHGAGLSVLEYAPVAEAMGRSFLAPMVFNCSAPDTGNMEVLHKYGSPAQQARWLRPLLDAEIRSVFAMTEPDVASSDATNMETTAVLDGDEVVLDGRKWWSSGLGDPEAAVAIVMARTPDPTRGRHGQHSMVLVPLDTPGVEVVRMLPVLGEYDAPHGHGELRLRGVRVPADHVIAGLGRGFEIAQGRLGPGRIHHCMRCIGAAEVCLESAIRRGSSRVAFGSKLVDLGGNRERIAEARIAIDQARLLTLYAAHRIDTVGAAASMTEISAIKVVAPNVLQQVADFAIQIHGGAGVSNDTPVARFFGQARALRLADGPDEVHKAVIARLELQKHATDGRR